jgi:hypothetical protein
MARDKLLPAVMAAARDEDDEEVPLSEPKHEQRGFACGQF